MVCLVSVHRSSPQEKQNAVNKTHSLICTDSLRQGSSNFMVRFPQATKWERGLSNQCCCHTYTDLTISSNCYYNSILKKKSVGCHHRFKKTDNKICLMCALLSNISLFLVELLPGTKCHTFSNFTHYDTLNASFPEARYHFVQLSVTGKGKAVNV